MPLKIDAVSQPNEQTDLFPMKTLRESHKNHFDRFGNIIGTTTELWFENPNPVKD